MLRGHRGSVLTLFAFAEPNLLLSGGRDNLIRCWVRSLAPPMVVAMGRAA